MKKAISLVCVATLWLAEVAPAQTPEPKPYTGTGFFSFFKRKYEPRPSPAVDFTNSGRLDKLMRAGRIYLSLEDAIALALENNLDIEFARFGPKIADTDVQRSKAGQLLRTSQSGVRGGSSSASGALAGASGISTSNAITSSSSGQGGILSGASVQLAGSGVPDLEPYFYFGSQFGHQTQILTNSFATGTNYLVSGYKALDYGFTKKFLSGTSVSIDSNSQNLSQNAPRSDWNPTTSGALSVTLRQNLLQGFGWKINGRYITIAKNNRHSADLNFKAQVMATVKNVVDLYYDLVSFNDLLKVRQEALELNKKLYTDNQRRAELGAIAPIDIVQAEGEVAASQQNVTNAETQVLQQEMILKSVLTRSGVDSMAIADARIVPTTRFQVPEKEPVQPVQDLVAEAIAIRPEVEQSKISLENSRLTMMGVKNSMLPTLSVFSTLQNSALAGQMNSSTIPGDEGLALLAQRQANLNPFFVGGYGNFLGQLFRRNFPDYSIGFSLNVPLRNTSTQADYTNAQLTYRQSQINDRQTNNSIRLNVINARTALLQARAAYDTSVKARMLKEQTLNGERRKFQLGTSSFLNVVIVQRDAVSAQESEVSALNSYMRYRNNLSAMVGSILQDFNVSMDEAYTGIVKREPDLPIGPNGTGGR